MRNVDLPVLEGLALLFGHARHRGEFQIGGSRVAQEQLRGEAAVTPAPSRVVERELPFFVVGLVGDLEQLRADGETLRGVEGRQIVGADVQRLAEGPACAAASGNLQRLETLCRGALQGLRVGIGHRQASQQCGAPGAVCAADSSEGILQELPQHVVGSRSGVPGAESQSGARQRLGLFEFPGEVGRLAELLSRQGPLARPRVGVAQGQQYLAAELRVSFGGQAQGFEHPLVLLRGFFPGENRHGVLGRPTPEDHRLIHLTRRRGLKEVIGELG